MAKISIENIHSWRRAQKNLKQLVSYRETFPERKDIERTMKEPPHIHTSLTYSLWTKYYDWPSKIERKISERDNYNGGKLPATRSSLH